jgi:regulator of replication initiation timing
MHLGDLMFEAEFSNLEQLIQKLISDNQQLKTQVQELNHKEQLLQQELKKNADQLETLQLHVMESDDQKQRTQQKLQQLTQLFEQQLSA